MDTSARLETPQTDVLINYGASRAVSGADVLVVIPTFNEEANLETCIRTLMNGDRRLNDVEFVIADGGSTDRTRRIAADLIDEFPNLRLILNPKRLQAAAVNLAARVFGAGRRILVRCDAHSLYPPGFVMAVADSLNQKGVASVVVPMDAVGRTCFQRAAAWIVDTPFGSGGAAHRGGRTSMFVDHGHHAGFDLKTFLHIGGYDETFSHNEDAEFDKRLRDAGGRIFLDAGIRLRYLPRDTASAMARQYFNYGKGRARTILTHGEMPQLRQVMPVLTLFVCVLGLTIAPLDPRGLFLPGGYALALVLASIITAMRHRSFCGLAAGAALLTMHMSWAAGFLRQMALAPKRLRKSSFSAP